MVEPRLIYALKGVYIGRPKIARRSCGLYAVGGKMLCSGEKLYCSRTFVLIVVVFQLIV
jgi:hypothetical protein